MRPTVRDCGVQLRRQFGGVYFVGSRVRAICKGFLSRWALMQVELLGVVAIICGVLSWLLGRGLPAYLLFISTLFGAGAALILPTLGYSNIQPAHLLLAFLTVHIFFRRDYIERIFHALQFPNEGFWLFLTAGYGVLSAVVFPRFFSGSTYVYTVARTAVGAGILAIPLGPTSSNITQTVYFVGDVCCFLFFYAFSGSENGLKSMLKAALAVASINLGFAALDLITYFTGTSSLLNFMRNANYQMWNETVVVGFKRITGSFPEASTFAATTVGLFGFCVRLSLSGIYPLLTSSLSVLSFGALVFATSSTGYVATAALLTWLFLSCLAEIFVRPVARATIIFLVLAPLTVAALGVGITLHQPTLDVVEDLGSTMVINKLSTGSGEERTRWNEQALRNFADTSGFGAGIGSVRASSFPVAVLGSVGVFGAFTYAMFLCGVFFRRKIRWRDRFGAAVQRSARAACLGQLLAACAAGGFIDLGLQFFIFAAMACAGPWRAQEGVQSYSGRQASDFRGIGGKAPA